MSPRFNPMGIQLKLHLGKRDPAEQASGLRERLDDLEMIQATGFDQPNVVSCPLDERCKRPRLALELIALEFTDIEFAQARDLDVECLTVCLNPTVLGARHDSSGGAALGQTTAPGLSLLPACDLVDPLAVDFLRSELQLEALAHHAGKKAAHRVRLPAGCLHHRVNGRARGG